MMEEEEKGWGGDIDSKREILSLIIFKSSNILCEVMGIISYFKNREKKTCKQLRGWSEIWYEGEKIGEMQ